MLPAPNNSSQVQCHGCHRSFSPRGLSQHLSKDSACRALRMASRTPSLFHNPSPAGSSLAPLGSISNPASCDRCVEDPRNETSSELFTFYAYMSVVDDFPKGPSNPGDDAPPADTPTSPTIQAQGHSADPAEYPAEDTADATDATDADLLQELSNDDPTFTSMEQVGHAEAQASAPVVTMEPAPAPPRFPIQPDAESLQAAPEPFVERFSLGDPGAPHLGMQQGTSIYKSRQAAFGASTWAPFHSQWDWEIARWAKMRGPSSSAMEELLAIPSVRVLQLVARGFLTDLKGGRKT